MENDWFHSFVPVISHVHTAFQLVGCNVQQSALKMESLLVHVVGWPSIYLDICFLLKETPFVTSEYRSQYCSATRANVVEFQLVFVSFLQIKVVHAGGVGILCAQLAGQQRESSLCGLKHDANCQLGNKQQLPVYIFLLKNFSCVGMYQNPSCLVTHLYITTLALMLYTAMVSLAFLVCDV